MTRTTKAAIERVEKFAHSLALDAGIRPALFAVVAAAKLGEAYRSQVEQMPEPQRSALQMLCEPMASITWARAKRRFAAALAPKAGGTVVYRRSGSRGRGVRRALAPKKGRRTARTAR